jgi:hypothetical protein
MLLRSLDGSEFELTIEGYEFPGEKAHLHDMNWLVISIRVDVPAGSWEATGPYMLTEDAGHLAERLDALSKDQLIDPEVDFLEPNLRFERTSIVGDVVSLRVHFALEFLPPWAVADGIGEFHVDLELASRDMRLAANSLREELSRFPPRTPLGAKRRMGLKKRQ